jgi:hypothetical protein
LKTTATIARALIAVACLAVTVGSVSAEAEYLRLRPHKEPAPCVATVKGKCPLVAAPRINKRISTIPGIANPDFGKPPVFRLPPRTGGYASGYRTIGGNRGITGGL